VEYCPTCDGGATFISTQTDPFSLEKRLTLHLDDTTSRVTIEHCVTNKGRAPLTLASWGITVVEPGGIAIIPQPELGEHPRDFSPNRNLVLWPYTDLADDRYTFGSRYIFLRQEEERQPTKIGLFHREQWVAYIWENSLFLKSIECIPEATYPDAGCNFETFTNSAMLELESLSPLTTLAPGGSVSHRENWHLFDLSDPVEIQSEDSLREWLFPFLVQAGYSG
ncbi:MAG: hypothetical protein ABIP97_05600, partial [Chthoniobacterales bacterium]